MGILFLCFVFSIFSSSSLAAGTSNFDTSSTPISLSYGTIPPKGQSITEPITGATVTRRTNVAELLPNLPNHAMVVYSRFTPTNTSGEYLLVHGTNSTSCWVVRLSDNSVVAKLFKADGKEIGETSEIRWDYSGSYPYRVYFVDGMKFYQMDVLKENGSPTLIRDFSSDFPSAVSIMNDVEGDSSNDSRFWAWQLLGAYSYSLGTFPRIAFIVYDKQSNSIVGKFLPSNNPNYAASSLPKPNMVEISPLGTKVLLHYGRAQNRAFTFPGPWISDGNGIYHMTGYKAVSAGNSYFSYVRSNGTDLTILQESSGAATSITAPGQVSINSSRDTIWLRLPDSSDPSSHVITGNWGSRPWDAGTEFDGPHVFNLDFTNPIKVSADETHSGWCFDNTGKEVFLSQDNTRDKIQACWIDGTGGAYPANCIDVLDHSSDLGYTNFHFGKFYTNIRGWFQMSTYDNRINQWSYNTILMVQLKPRVDGPKIWRITPTFNQYSGNYRDESSAALGYDGKSLWWTANWGNAANDHGEVFSVSLPNNWVDFKQDINIPGKPRLTK